MDRGMAFSAFADHRSMLVQLHDHRCTFSRVVDLTQRPSTIMLRAVVKHVMVLSVLVGREMVLSAVVDRGMVLSALIFGGMKGQFSMVE